MWKDVPNAITGMVIFLVVYLPLLHTISKDLEDANGFLTVMWILPIVASMLFLSMIIILFYVRAHRVNSYRARFRLTDGRARRAIEAFVGHGGSWNVEGGHMEVRVGRLEVRIWVQPSDGRTWVHVSPVPGEGREEFLGWLDRLTDALFVAE